MSYSLERNKGSVIAPVDSLLAERVDTGRAMEPYDHSSSFRVELCAFGSKYGGKVCVTGCYGNEQGEWQHLQIPNNLGVFGLVVRSCESAYYRRRYTTEAYLQIPKEIMIEVGQIRTYDRSSETHPGVKYETLYHNDKSLWRVTIEDCGGFYMKGSEGNSFALVTGQISRGSLMDVSYIGENAVETVQDFLLKPGN